MSALVTHYKPKPGQTFVASIETDESTVRVTRFDGGEVRLNVSGKSRDLQISFEGCEASALRDLLAEATEGETA